MMDANLYNVRMPGTCQSEDTSFSILSLKMHRPVMGSNAIFLSNHHSMWCHTLHMLTTIYSKDVATFTIFYNENSLPKQEPPRTKHDPEVTDFRFCDRQLQF